MRWHGARAGSKNMTKQISKVRDGLLSLAEEKSTIEEALKRQGLPGIHSLVVNEVGQEEWTVSDTNDDPAPRECVLQVGKGTGLPTKTAEEMLETMQDGVMRVERGFFKGEAASASA